MNLALLVKIDVILLVLSFVGMFATFIRKGQHVIALKKLEDDAKHVFRYVKNKVAMVLDTKEEVAPVERPDRDKEVTPEDHVEVQKRLRSAEMSLAQNEFEEAEKILIDALGYHPDDEDANVMLAYVYMKRKKFSKAESIYLELIEQNAGDPSIYTNLGKVLEEQGNYEMAMKAYEEAIKKEPAEPYRYVQYAGVMTRMNVHGKAVEALEHATKLNSKDIEILFLLAGCYIVTREYKLAGQVLNRILNIEPYNEKAKVELLTLKEKGYIQE